MKHKLVIFILKNPKKSKKGAKGETNGNGGRAHASAPSVPPDENAGGSGSDSDDEITRKILLPRLSRLALRRWKVRLAYCDCQGPAQRFVLLFLIYAVSCQGRG
ncbi:hypothetical protein BDR07DRAFT_1406211 [Suillus spraguei]|nr:hypothetical protein BDR07DRAFT_1406211 [Suillus spraguei]